MSKGWRSLAVSAADGPSDSASQLVVAESQVVSDQWRRPPILGRCDALAGLHMMVCANAVISSTCGQAVGAGEPAPSTASGLRRPGRAAAYRAKVWMALDGRPPCRMPGGQDGECPSQRPVSAPSQWARACLI